MTRREIIAVIVLAIGILFLIIGMCGRISSGVLYRSDYDKLCFGALLTLLSMPISGEFDKDEDDETENSKGR